MSDLKDLEKKINSELTTKIKSNETISNATKIKIEG